MRHFSMFTKLLSFRIIFLDLKFIIGDICFNDVMASNGFNPVGGHTRYSFLFEPEKPAFGRVTLGFFPPSDRFQGTELPG